MKTQGGNIGKTNTTEDKIVRVDATESELDSNPIQQVLGVNELLPQLSILQLSDVGLKTKKTFKGKAGKALIVGTDERSIEFGEGGGGGGMPNTIPFVLTYANNVDVDLSKSLNYILTLTGNCNLTFGQQPGHQGFSNGYTYNIILIQDAYGGHTINLPSGFLYADGYSQDTTAGGVSILTIKFDNGMCFASICKYSPLSVAGPRLEFTANTPGSTVTLDNASSAMISGLRYSFDGITRNAYSNGYTITLTNVGDKVLFKNILEGAGASSSGQFSMTGSISCSGDVTYLVNKNGGDITLYASAFANLFEGCTSLVTPPSLPSTTVGNNCYYAMFRNCTSLIIAPELPATNIGSGCYEVMFAGCTSLTTAPALPATTIADSCYQGMFSGCTALTTAPELPATTMEYCCYYFMFASCTSLTTAPELPATTLDTMCYTQMFQSCTSLTTIPALPASTLVSSCYNGMFMNCTNIKLSETQTGEYQTPYRIPPSVQGTQGTDPTMNYMFSNTGGTFTGTPTINTRYYTSNTIV